MFYPVNVAQDLPPLPSILTREKSSCKSLHNDVYIKIVIINKNGVLPPICLAFLVNLVYSKHTARQFRRSFIVCLLIYSTVHE